MATVIIDALVMDRGLFLSLTTIMIVTITACTWQDYLTRLPMSKSHAAIMLKMGLGTQRQLLALLDCKALCMGVCACQ